MAIQFVGSTSNVGTSNGYTVSLSGTLTGGIASSPATGDIVLVVSAFGNTASSAPNVSGNQSGAYTGFQTAVHVNDTYDTEFRTFYKVMGSTPDSTLTITRTTNTAYGGATIVMVYRGQHTTSPFTQNSSYTTKTNSAYATPANASLSATDEWAISFGAGTQPSTGSAFTVPSQLTGNQLSVKGDGSTSDIGVWAADVAPATTGNYTISAASGGVSNSSCSGAAHTIVLAPEPTFVTHGTSGTLTGQLGSITGSAARTPPITLHADTGVIVGPGSVLDGASSRYRQMASTSTLVGPGASLAASASRYRSIDSTGVLQGQVAAVVGSAVLLKTHTTSGALVGVSSVLDGNAVHVPVIPPPSGGQSRFTFSFASMAKQFSTPFAS